MVQNDLGDWGGDSARYVLVARRLALGEGKELIDPLGKARLYFYHILTPLLIVPIIKVFGFNFLILRLFFVILSCLALILVYKLYKEKGDYFSLFIMLLMAFSPLFLYYTSLILTEVPYIVFSLLSLITIVHKMRPSIPLEKEDLLFFFWVLLAFLTRYIAISIIFAVVIYLVIKKRGYKKAFLITLVCFSLIFCWFYLSSYFDKECKFLRQFLWRDPYDLGKGVVTFDELLLRWKNNLIFYFENLPIVIIPLLRKSIIFKYLCLLIIVLGLSMKLKREGADVLDIYFFLYLFILSIWWWKRYRFMLPLIFLISYYFIYGLIFIFRKKTITSLILSFAIIVNLYDCLGLIRWQRAHQKIDSPALLEFIQLNYWIRDHIKDKDILIISRKPENTALITGKPSTCYPFIKAPWEIFYFMRRVGARYVIVDRFSPQSIQILKPTIELYQNYFRLVKCIGGTCLYEFTYVD
jgi:hypothetical protein